MLHKEVKMRQGAGDAGFTAAYPYVIQMDNERYFCRQTRKKIYCGSLWNAKRFPDEGSAEEYIRFKLSYVGMEVYICRIGFALFSSEMYPHSRYWNGAGFSQIQDDAVLFFDHVSALTYQRANRLLDVCYVDMLAQRTKKVCIAA